MEIPHIMELLVSEYTIKEKNVFYTVLRDIFICMDIFFLYRRERRGGGQEFEGFWSSHSHPHGQSIFIVPQLCLIRQIPGMAEAQILQDEI